MSEFGRRVAQNAANSTGHGHGNRMFIVSGAAVQAVHSVWSRRTSQRTRTCR